MSVSNPITSQNQPLFIGGIPKEGPQSIMVDLDLTNDQFLDFSMELSTGKISGIQAVYMDLKNCDQAVELTCVDTGQVIKAPPYTQGYYPVITGSYLKFKLSSGFNGNVPIFFLNFAIASGWWITQ